jgi:hypothetical protein
MIGKDFGWAKFRLEILNFPKIVDFNYQSTYNEFNRELKEI